MKIFNINFADFAFHRDLRCGLGLIEFRCVVNQLASPKYPTVKLGEILSLEYGKGLTDEDRSGGDFPVVGSNGVVGYHDEYLVESPCIVIGRKGSAGEITYLEENCFPIDTTFYVKLKTDRFDIKFLSYLLRILKLQRLALFKGVPGLNRYDVYEAKISLIPITTQEEILEKIKPIEREIENLQAQIGAPTEPINRVFAREFNFDLERFEELKRQKTFSLTLEDFSANQDLRFSVKFHRPAAQFVESQLRGITDKSIKDFLAENIVLGASVSPDDYDDNGEFYYVAMSSIKSWSFDEDNSRLVSDAYSERNKAKLVNESDIIIARSGEGTIGKVALIEDDVKGIFADFTMRIRLKNYNAKFAYYYFRTEYFQYLIETHKKGLGNNTNIFPVQIKQFPMPNISTKKQIEILDEINVEFAAQSAIKRKIEEKRAAIDRIIERVLK